MAIWYLDDYKEILAGRNPDLTTTCHWCEKPMIQGGTLFMNKIEAARTWVAAFCNEHPGIDWNEGAYYSWIILRRFKHSPKEITISGSVE